MSHNYETSCQRRVQNFVSKIWPNFADRGSCQVHRVLRCVRIFLTCLPIYPRRAACFQRNTPKKLVRSISNIKVPGPMCPIVITNVLLKFLITRPLTICKDSTKLTTVVLSSLLHSRNIFLANCRNITIKVIAKIT